MITAKGQAKRILIADDEPGVIMILAMRLRANGYHVIAAHDGMQAIELANREKPDLILLDIKMPDKDGYAVFEELRASVNTRSTPVIFFSALPPERAEEKAAQLGADGFVSKSADPEEIVARIRGILIQLENKMVLTGIRK
jgi:DNA-binding response OmpR family regulator